MKPVKNLVLAALLVFSIALNTFGGDIDLPGAPAPTPPPRVTAATGELTSDTNSENQETTDAADYLFFEVLTALLSVY